MHHRRQFEISGVGLNDAEISNTYIPTTCQIYNKFRVFQHDFSGISLACRRDMSIKMAYSNCPAPAECHARIQR